VPIALSPVALLPLVGLALPIVMVTRSVLRNRGSSGGRHSGGAQNDFQGAAASDPRFAAQPDPRFAYAPDPRFGVADTAFPLVAAAATSVLASTGPSSAGAQSDFVQSSSVATTSGDPFPTTGRALALTGGQVLAALGWLVLGLSSTPTGHHMAHVGNSSMGFLGILCVFVGASFFTVATSGVQRDVMGGGWNSRFSLRYISPQIAWYVISPAGISAAANRLNIAPALAMLAVYGLLACDVLLMGARYLGH
jgi:hypothetical protein